MNQEKDFITFFMDKARQFSDKTAIVDMDGTRKTTYRELNTLSGKISAVLKKSGVKKGDAVIICMDRKMEYIASELAVLKCGAAFVALLPEYPQERIQYIKGDCHAVLMIDEEFFSKMRASEIFDAEIPDAEVPDVEQVSPSDPAFMIYTSGSTGNPKGMIHTHKSLTASVLRHKKVLELKETDIQLVNAPFSFIVMCLEIYTPLSIGGAVHILSDEKRKNVRALEAYIVEHHITVTFISPQMLRLFSAECSDLRLVVTGSERVSNITGHGYRFLNLFGCSETAAMATYFEVDKKYDNTPIGKAAPGIKAVLLDDKGREVETGEEGELCVIGDIAHTYINLPEQSRDAFIPQEDGMVLFHTKDICRRLPDGNLVYVNRKDWMVKVNGQRVEIGEIEAVLSGIRQVDVAVVKNFLNAYGQTYLAAYYTLKDPEQDLLSEEEIRDTLSRRLPQYMIPQYFVKMEKMPLNVNGKLDRKQLQAPDMNHRQSDYAPPQDEKQAAVCAAFETTLKLDKVGINDDFFNMGGDSIQVMMLLTHLDGLEPGHIYENRTPKKIAEVWTKEKGHTEENLASEPKFQNQFDSAGRMRILAGMRYYKKTQDENNMPRTSIVFHDPVDPDCLEYAVRTALPRFKVHRFKVVGDEYRYYLKLNDAPPVVHLNDGTRQKVGGNENNGYLTRIGYSGNEITIDMFHGINDGVGSMPFLKTLLYYYCEKKYGTDRRGLTDLILADTPEDPREYADCMLFLPEEERTPKGKYAYSEAFYLPDEQMKSPWECRHYQLTVNAADLERYTRLHDTSVSAVFALFANKTIAGLNDRKGLPVVGAMAVDARAAYKAERTMQCCVATIPIYYEDRMEDMTLSEQLKETRRIVMQQANADNILASAVGTRKFNEKMEAEYPMLADKMKFCREVNDRSSHRYTYGISYIGDFSLGAGIDEHIAEFNALLPANTIPVIMEILKFKDQYIVNYMSHLEEDRYIYALKDLFLCEEMSCELVRKENFKECIAQFESL